VDGWDMQHGHNMALCPMACGAELFLEKRQIRKKLADKMVGAPLSPPSLPATS
jgi:hypothetical protein